MLLVATLLLTSAVARSNPYIPPVDWSLHHWPEDYVRHHSTEAARNLVDRVGTGGLAHIDSQTLAYMDAHRDRFKPLVLEALRPPYLPDDGLIAWYRERASAHERDDLLAALRSWLTDPSLTARTEEVLLYGDRMPLSARVQGLTGRLMAAERLGDFGDRLSLPALHALREEIQHGSPAPSDDEPYSAPVVVDQAIARIERPTEAGFLAGGGGGPVILRRSRDDLVAMESGWMPRTTKRPGRRLSAIESRRYWTLLTAGRWAGPRPTAIDRPGIHLRFRDGLVAHLTLAESGYFDYRDNSRVELIPSGRIHAPELYEVLRPLYRPAPASAGGQMFEIVAVPDSVLHARYGRAPARPPRRRGPAK